MSEASNGIEVCVEHKQCLQREVVLQASLDTVVTGRENAVVNMADLVVVFLQEIPSPETALLT